MYDSTPEDDLSSLPIPTDEYIKFHNNFSGLEQEVYPIMWMKDYPGYWVYNGYLFEIPVWRWDFTDKLPDEKPLKGLLYRVLLNQGLLKENGVWQNGKIIQDT